MPVADARIKPVRLIFITNASYDKRRQSNKALSFISSVAPSDERGGHGILTMCPSASAFAMTLGPTNPWLSIIAKETLVFRRPGLSPGLWLLVPTFLLLDAPFQPHGGTSRRSRTLSYHPSLRMASFYVPNIFISATYFTCTIIVHLHSFKKTEAQCHSE